MAKLGIINTFSATHGSRNKREDRYSIELIIEGPIEGGFVAGVDYDEPIRKLERLIDQLNGNYLDDIVGRATIENIAQFLMSHLINNNVKTLRVYERNDIYIEISKEELDIGSYPIKLEFNLGHSYLLREDPSRAIDHFDKAIEMREDFAEAYNMRGRCYKYLEDFKSALENYQRAIAIDPEFGEAWRNLGNAYLFLEEYERMIPAFDRSIELLPNSALAINNRGYGYSVIGEYEQAICDHKKAVELDPNYAEAHYDLAMALDALGNHEEAKIHFAAAERLKDTGVDTYHNIAMH